MSSNALKRRTAYPIIGPTIQPTLQLKPVKGNASAWFVSSVSSATALCMIAEFPERAPASERARTAAQKERASPNRRVLIATPTRPERMTGLRPMRSEIKCYLLVSQSTFGYDMHSYLTVFPIEGR